MATEKIIATNCYKLKDIAINSNVTKEGTKEITNSGQEVDYHILYQATIKEYIGDAILTLTDILPYKIDEEKSNLGDGIYNEDTKTITWTRKIENIDTTKNGDCKIKIQGDIKLVYKDLNPKEIKMTNKLKAKIEFTEDNTKNEIEDSHDTNININGKVKVKYIDKDTGKELTRIVLPGEVGNEEGKEPIAKPYSYEIEGKVGEDYKTIFYEIDTYDYLENTGKAEGQIQEGETEVIHYYTKSKSGGITVKYVDENGNDILPEEVLTGKIGDPYQTILKEIPNYEFVEITGHIPEGEMTKEPKEIKDHYKRIPTTVVVKYLEKETNRVLAEEETINGYVGQNYKTQRKVIQNYQKAEPEPENVTGTMTKETIEIIYYYEKIPSGKVTVKYVDIDTNEEIIYIDEEGKIQKYGYEISGYVGEKYQTEEKQIPYYKYQEELQTTPKEGYYTQNDETIIYYYKKLAFNISIDKQIKNATIDGSPIPIGKDNKIMKVEIAKDKINTSNLQITYAIKVSNTGELDGKTTIYEKIPEGLSVIKTNSNDWKKTKDGNLSMLLNLKAGETKELEITLQWDNGETNFGSKTNQVAIMEVYNIANFRETTLEDNQSEATVIINIKTGGTWKILVSLLGGMVTIAGAIWFCKNRKTRI